MIITIVGLGVVGASYGLALKDKNIEVYGIDIDYKVLKKAKNMNIIKKHFLVLFYIIGKFVKVNIF